MLITEFSTKLSKCRDAKTLADSTKINATTSRKLYLIYFQHFLNDLHVSFLQTFLPFLVEKLDITVAQAGILTALPGLFDMLLQPFFGFVSDMTCRPYMIAWAPILTALGASLIPSAPSYGTALILVSIWGLGSTIFHPQAHGSIGYIGTIEKMPIQLAFFSALGILGSSMSPLYATFLFKYCRHTPLNLFPVIPVAAMGIFFWTVIPYIRKTTEKNRQCSTNFLKNATQVFSNIRSVWLVTFLRGITNQGVKFLFPLLVASRGGGIEKIGFSLFLLQLAKVLAPLAAGRLAIRYHSKKVLFFTQGLSPLLMFPELFNDGWLPLISFLLGNAFLVSSSPLLVARAQKLAPTSKSMATSLIMGVAFGLSGLMMSIVGKIVDIRGLVPAFSIILLFPFFNLIIIRFKWDK